MMVAVRNKSRKIGDMGNYRNYVSITLSAFSLPQGELYCQAIVSESFIMS